jgi:cholesterol transport system auxiliary component
MSKALAAAVAAGLVLLGCASDPKPPVSTFDFGVRDAAVTGLPSYATRLPKLIALPDVAAPIWMDSPAVVFRLAHKSGRPESYAYSRWVMPPAQLITERLKSRASALGVTTQIPEHALRAPQLRIEIEEFSHQFTADTQSQALLIARVTVTENGALTRASPYRITRAAATPDAPGGAKAMAEAADELVEQALTFLAGPPK